MQLVIVVLNYRTPQLVIDCLESFAPEIISGRDRAIVVDNCSPDDSADQIAAAIEQHNWTWVELVRSERNDGFSAGNNVGMRAATDADAWFLVNSDTIARPGVLNELHAALEAHPKAGLISPRLEWPDGRPQISCFRSISPISELLAAARTGPLSRLLRRWEVALPLSGNIIRPQWTSFAAVIVRRQLWDQIGPMDEGYFMYFEDVDYAHRTRAADWDIVHWPHARMVHLRGGSSEVKSATAARKRRPAYFYAARSRYFAKFYGGTVGLWLTNMVWGLGRTISWTRELIGRKQPHTCHYEERDIWTNWRDPLNPNKRGV